MEAHEARLKAAGRRLTTPRRRLLEALGRASRPLSAEELQASSGEAVDLVTVYRNLAVFAEQGMVQSIQLEGGKQLFELQRSASDHHHHIVCRRCHEVERLDLCFGSELEKYARSKGFSELTHTIEVFGLCPTCAKAEG